MSSVPLLYETVVGCMHKNEFNVLIFCIGSALLWKLAQTKEAIAVSKFNFAFMYSKKQFQHFFTDLDSSSIDKKTNGLRNQGSVQKPTPASNSYGKADIATSDLMRLELCS